MGRKTISLSVDEATYEAYKRYCEQRGIILSKQFEIFMKGELKNNKRGNYI